MTTLYDIFTEQELKEIFKIRNLVFFYNDELEIKHLTVKQLHKLALTFYELENPGKQNVEMKTDMTTYAWSVIMKRCVEKEVFIFE